MNTQRRQILKNSLLREVESRTSGTTDTVRTSSYRTFRSESCGTKGDGFPSIGNDFTVSTSTTPNSSARTGEICSSRVIGPSVGFFMGPFSYFRRVAFSPTVPAHSPKKLFRPMHSPSLAFFQEEGRRVPVTRTFQSSRSSSSTEQSVPTTQRRQSSPSLISEKSRTPFRRTN